MVTWWSNSPISWEQNIVNPLFYLSVSGWLSGYSFHKDKKNTTKIYIFLPDLTQERSGRFLKIWN